ncbi:kinase-like domain-containing protein [Syncephalis fuscata]|nr:kinase-like domain-containing protein [Syncephalis fuscata]
MYPDPMQWFIHRLNYANTAAVMSMVGYMVGLGDRHGENILLDESNGDCVHVDFNCLFEKGKKLAIPEMVPFRLTHNMVDALGVTGYEGVFRRSCEVTTHVLRGHTESLMSTLEAFAHDPLVEWNKTPNQANNTTGNAHGGETVNAKAAESLEKIHNKLKGVQDSGLPLSVEGYVNELIREATNTKSLAEMYVGWAPYL